MLRGELRHRARPVMSGLLTESEPKIEGGRLSPWRWLFVSGSCLDNGIFHGKASMLLYLATVKFDQVESLILLLFSSTLPAESSRRLAPGRSQQVALSLAAPLSRNASLRHSFFSLATRNSQTHSLIALVKRAALSTPQSLARCALYRLIASACV